MVFFRLTNFETTLFFSLAMFLFTDSLIAFKGNILFCFGVYFMTILKLLYQSARPFWIMGEISVQPGACKFDFAMPSDQIFSVVFFWNYNLFMYFIRYTEKVNHVLVIMLYSLLGAFTLVLVFGIFVLGQTYIYQSFISMLFSFIFFVLCINFDNEILDRCEKIGFIVRSSRKYKFYLFFLCIGLFIIAQAMT